MVMLIHICVKGRVQGVGYRAFACREAHKCGVSGWVRNRADGSVEILARGGEKEIDLFLNACRRGPTFGRVDSVTPVSIPTAVLFPIEEGVFVTMPTV